MHEDGRFDVTIHDAIVEDGYLVDDPPIFEVPQYTKDRYIPSLNVVIQIVGSRGDVQPFLPIGQELLRRGHRVRLATHETFRKFITDAGLEFYPLAGDPVELMAYMVKNPGLLPSIQSIKEGDISKKRRMIKDILDSAWDSCTKPDEENQRPFLADVIIANPPSFAHIHCAEKLCIPLHIMFTMPWSPTRAFPHPLSNMVDYTNSPREVVNLLSYDAIETLTWQGLGDIINNFRKRTLQLPGLQFTVGPYLLKDLGVPHTYCWSPSLIPKPQDWRPHINVSGFSFLDLANEYSPSSSLKTFLESGPPPVYIGFGSIVVDDPDQLTKTIFDAVRQAGVRALVSKGWGGLGGDEIPIPEDVMIIENCPHDWLFPRCVAVCHHGGAGTTAAGLRAGKSTIIVPFFGDQPFWGRMTADIGCGPPPIPFKQLTKENLADAIRFAVSADTLQQAMEIGRKIQSENGAIATVDTFLANLPLDDMMCDVEPTRLATLYAEDVRLKLCPAVAEILLSQGRIKADKLRPYGPKHWYTEVVLENLLSASVSAAWALCHGFVKGTTSVVSESSKGIQKAQGKPIDQATKEILLGVGKGLAGTLGHTILGKSLQSLGDGFRNTTALIDKSEPVRPTPMVGGAVDGVAKGFKEFGRGVGEGRYSTTPGPRLALTSLLITGFADFFTKPVKGAMKEGMPGLGKGFAAGSISFLTKPLAGCIDLVTLSSQGIYNSASGFIEQESRTNADGKNFEVEPLDVQKVIQKFETVMQK
ncbi:UDP-Glycosyltransferase/glycogen phosphorylase [Basidiobolus meristosporus CBS 931.73]|uniref:UDP-Glycosyltransferase/glycogen phosphorylase n=1 Tax=Basidiobolus meristosporus CBS 931.73 TaxID=1314790 RepID=A0A1Y1YYK6_9FUNG|nr:UDP-Glycosyltransferase/glycogen phosphorylase [Basidiobolus meristosporus CBS 931.73]|eukprot:ORY03123.1 UDP-Glycosyltransferase/glycogen phosphorylase [Basidiobolus meristosporus CBS 931.73]